MPDACPPALRIIRREPVIAIIVTTCAQHTQVPLGQLSHSENPKPYPGSEINNFTLTINDVYKLKKMGDIH